MFINYNVVLIYIKIDTLYENIFEKQLFFLVFNRYLYYVVIIANYIQGNGGIQYDLLVTQDSPFGEQNWTTLANHTISTITDLTLDLGEVYPPSLPPLPLPPPSLILLIEEDITSEFYPGMAQVAAPI